MRKSIQIIGLSIVAAAGRSDLPILTDGNTLEFGGVVIRTAEQDWEWDGHFQSGCALPRNFQITGRLVGEDDIHPIDGKWREAVLFGLSPEPLREDTAFAIDVGFLIDQNSFQWFIGSEFEGGFFVSKDTPASKGDRFTITRAGGRIRLFHNKTELGKPRPIPPGRIYYLDGNIAYFMNEFEIYFEKK